MWMLNLFLSLEGEMSSLDEILAGMDAWSNAQVYPTKKPVTPAAKAAPKRPTANPSPAANPAPAAPSPKKVLKKRKIDQFFEKVEVPESEKQKKAKALLDKLLKPQGTYNTRIISLRTFSNRAHIY